MKRFFLFIALAAALTLFVIAAGTASAASSYKSGNSLNQISRMGSLCHGFFRCHRHQVYFAVLFRSEYNYALSQLFLQLIAQLTESVHIHVIRFGCQQPDTPDLFYLIHYIAQ